MNYLTYGTDTLLAEPTNLTRIAGVVIEQETLTLRLSDGRCIQLEMRRYPWLAWLVAATAEQRSQWEVVPSGGGVWWTKLDDGIELQPLLDMQPLI